jgi:hypothetical protein
MPHNHHDLTFASPSTLCYIPNELCWLLQLRSGNNALTGGVPTELGNLLALEVFDISKCVCPVSFMLVICLIFPVAV